MQKKAPWILLVFLLLILIFIVGVRYGQQVEKTNKTTVVLLSLTPTKRPEPTRTLAFQTYQNKACGVQFVYPAALTMKDASLSAEFFRDSAIAIKLTCEKILPKTATPAGYLQKKVVNQRSAKTTLFTVAKDLFPLLEGTLKSL